MKRAGRRCTVLIGTALAAGVALTAAACAGSRTGPPYTVGDRPDAEGAGGPIVLAEPSRDAPEQRPSEAPSQDVRSVRVVAGTLDDVDQHRVEVAPAGGGDLELELQPDTVVLQEGVRITHEQLERVDEGVPVRASYVVDEAGDARALRLEIGRSPAAPRY